MLFQYTALGPTEIRLVTLLPYSTLRYPFLSLSHHDLTSFPPPDYTILASTPSQTRQHHCDRQSLTLAGRSFMVPTDLHAALSALPTSPQHRDKNFWTWDLCINQRDQVERSREGQPERLAEIVRAADEVLVWLDGQDVERDGDGGDWHHALADMLPLGPLLLENARKLRPISHANLHSADAHDGRSKV